MVTDPIADYLTRVRNAIKAKHKIVDVPASNVKKEMTKVLFDKGYIANYKFELTLRPIPGINLSAEYSFTDVTAEGEGFSTNLYRVNLGFDFTPDLSLSSNIQYDDVSHLLGTNTRFRWIITPGTDVFLVYNHNWLDEPLQPTYTLQRGLALKAVYTHRF